MPIVDLQRRWRELGRIRLGEKGSTSKNGKQVFFPKKLSEFRLTSASEELLTVAADMYGGSVREWAGAPTQGKQWELLTGVDRLDVIVPPGEPLTQHWELWSGGGCERRCDGAARDDGQACACPADLEQRGALAQQGKACKATTRLSVILPRVPDIGIWRVETHGLNAAVELPGTVDILRRALDSGELVPAQLRLDQRVSKKNGETRQFVVPVLELPTVTTGQLMSGDVRGIGKADGPALAAPTPVAIGPGESAVPEPTPTAPVRAPATKKATPVKKAAARREEPPLPTDPEDGVSEAEFEVVQQRINRLPREVAVALRQSFDTAAIPLERGEMRARHLRKVNALLAGVERDAPAEQSDTNEGPFAEDGSDADNAAQFGRRMRWVHAEMNKVPPLVEGDDSTVAARRHALVRQASKGAKESSRELTEVEARAVIASIADIASGHADVVRRANGGFEFRRSTR